jgi:hypothetical protein
VNLPFVICPTNTSQRAVTGKWMGGRCREYPTQPSALYVTQTVQERRQPYDRQKFGTRFVVAVTDVIGRFCGQSTRLVSCGNRKAP